MILVDWPQWPAHGRLWAHLVSDTSLAELHDFARGADVPSRAFDLDHYDVPAERVADLVRAGAVQVTPRELLAALVRSGLRVPGRRRPTEKQQRRDHDLRRRWEHLGAVVPHEAGGAWAGVGADLLTRWSEPHRRYHNLDHLHDVLTYLDILAAGGELVTQSAVLAAWFHDAVYEGRVGVEAGLDEEESAVLAERQLLLVGVAEPLAAETARLVRATAAHTADGTTDPAAALLDADLAVLAAPPVRYEAYAQAVRHEYAHVPEPQFRAGRASILTRFLERDHLYLTPTARGRWEHDARANVAREIEQLLG